MRHLLCALVLGGVIAASSARAAALHPAVERQLGEITSRIAVSDETGAATLGVLLYLREQAPLLEVERDLDGTRTTRRERHRRIVTELQAILPSQEPVRRMLDQAMLEGKVRGYTSYWIVNALAVEATPEFILELTLRDDIEIIEPNWKSELIAPIEIGDDELDVPSPLHSARDRLPPGLRAIRAPEVWHEMGYTGLGRIVATIDSGASGTHPALRDRWQGLHSSPEAGWLDVREDTSFPADRLNHGTHVLGTITGMDPAGRDTVGVAWGANWICCNAISQGVGTEFDNDVLAGYQWFLDPDGDPETIDDVPDVVQNAWGINELRGGYEDCDTRFWDAIDACEAAGVVMVFSAGNEGPGGRTLRSPADRATTTLNGFSVGAIDATHFDWPHPIALFSSRGPSGCEGSPEVRIKPELVAPGVRIFSTVPGGYTDTFSGTSMSGPHVAGVVALMRQANPNLDTDTIKQILLDTARDLGEEGEDNTFGWGMLDAFAAMKVVTQGFGRFTATIKNRSLEDRALENVRITSRTSGHSFATNENGRSVGTLPPGIHELEISHPSFEVQILETEIFPDEDTDLTFFLDDASGPSIRDLTGLRKTADTEGPYEVVTIIDDFSAVTQALLWYRVDGGDWIPRPMACLDTYSTTIPGAPVGSRIDYYIEASDNNGLTSYYPDGAPSETVILYVTETLYTSSGNSHDPLWQIGSAADDATSGHWEWADPVGSLHHGLTIQMENDASPGDAYCFVTGNAPRSSAAGANDIDDGCTRLFSPVFDLDGYSHVFVSYARWFMMGGSSTDDALTVDVSSNGGASWTRLEQVTEQAPEWRPALFDLAEFVDVTDQMQVRFTACDQGEAGITEAGLDEFRIETFPGNGIGRSLVEPESGPLDLLEQSRPNPTRPELATVVRFQISNAAEARLVLYDAGGREIRTLVDEPLPAGVHAVTWDGRDDRGDRVESGVYFYRLEAGAFRQSRRLTLLR